MTHRPLLLLALLVFTPACGAQEGTRAADPPAPPWADAERGVLENHVQLTFGDRWVKAGEAYFSPDGTQVVFQAIAAPPEGEEPEAHYQMYVADFARDARDAITGLTNVVQLSPPGSSNTCGWFHPTRPDTVIFGSTLVVPGDGPAGYQRQDGRYVWQFPREMTIVMKDTVLEPGVDTPATVVLADPEAYLAECSLTRDGENLLYCRHVEAERMEGGDILVRHLPSGETTVLVDDRGYDGGPFFSPDEEWICYRSDRRIDNHLQLFVAELARDERGRIIGVRREIQVTDNEHVNWCPFWHPSGRGLVYATSEQGHRNYEVYWIDPRADDPESTKRRVTNAERFDGLPVFSADGSRMMWTSQRGETGTSQIWIADFLGEF